MRAVVRTNDSLSLTEYPAPQIAHADDVLIEVRIAGLCRTDIYAAQGLLPTNGPRVLGHEFSGTVKAIGTAVQHVQVGNLVGVMPIFENASDISMLGLHRDGGFAELILVPASHVYLVPDSVSAQEAAYLEPIAASLAVINAPITPDQRGVVYGDNRIAELTHRVLQCQGFDKVELCPLAANNPLQPNHYDYAIETLADETTMQHLVEAVKSGGLIILKSRPSRAVPMPISLIVKKQIRLIGAHYGDFQRGIDLLASGTLQVQDLFGECLPLDRAVDILSGKISVGEQKKIFFIP